MATLVQRAQVYADQTRLDAEQARIDRKFIIDFIMSVQDCLISFARTYDYRKFEHGIEQLKAKEGVRLTIDNWFWRPEPEISLREQLSRRGKYLKAGQYSIDQQWDLLVEFVSAWTKEDLDEGMIREIISEVHDVSSTG